jgi:hypothetical protein
MVCDQLTFLMGRLWHFSPERVPFLPNILDLQNDSSHRPFMTETTIRLANNYLQGTSSW